MKMTLSILVTVLRSLRDAVQVVGMVYTVYVVTRISNEILQASVDSILRVLVAIVLVLTVVISIIRQIPLIGQK